MQRSLFVIATALVALAAASALAQQQQQATCSITVAKASSSNSLPVATINEVLKMHNDARRAVNSKSMPLMTWNDDLALNQLNFFKQCGAGNSHSDQNTWRINKFGFSYIGENLGYTSQAGAQASDVAMFVQMWIDEKSGWTYEAAPCSKQAPCGVCGAGKVCGHYTQVVWEGSTQVGCALYTGCGDSRVGCMYGGGGNMWNEAPYVATSCQPACTAAVPAATATLSQSCTGCTTAAVTCASASTPVPPGGSPSGSSGGPASPGAGGNNSGSGSGGGAAGGGDGSGGGMGGGAIAGIVIGIVVGVALIGAVAFFVLRSRNKGITRSADDGDENSTTTTMQNKFENAGSLEAELLQTAANANALSSSQSKAGGGLL
jgi:pathogenesis-related protein 1